MDKIHEKQLAFDLAKATMTHVRKEKPAIGKFVDGVVVEFSSTCVAQYTGKKADDLTVETTLKKIKVGIKVVAQTAASATIVVIHCGGAVK